MRVLTGFFSLALCVYFQTALLAAEPVVHMLVPGFTVKELPIRISNINNLRFAPDGRLTALGYDGRVHLLRDSDGDGLEDEDQLFWDRPSLSVPVGMVWAPEGLYVSSHGKVSLLRDTDHDGKGDVEEIIASGWPPTDVGSGGVDATAVARDKEGNLYFGLLVADYSNAYRIKDGVSRYDIKSPRGTIQKWNAKTKKLETIATGIRVPYTLAFNGQGDLFLTDQEGETWMPNGNPLDELNHIVAGRNYGFPPRHEKWLPNLISEPPVVAFGPQHQSTCGLVFNEPAPKNDWSPGRKIFGPKWWEGDAFVAGESRGKIWRVRLVKTPDGYVGKEYLISRLTMLTTDLAISPKGDFYVSCHSGQPDWGTGPQGEGKLFKISYTDPDAPQPVAAWAGDAMEVRVVFDRALSSSTTNGLAGKAIECGEYVRAADRFEELKPPYQVVKYQEATPRGTIRIQAVQVTDRGHLLVLKTDPHPVAATYALTLPQVKSLNRPLTGTGASVDLDYNLNGVDAIWTGPEGQPMRTWLPHLDLAVARQMTAGSSTHQKFFDQLGDRQTRLDLHTRVMLPKGDYTLHFRANELFNVSTGTNRLPSHRTNSLPHVAELNVTSMDEPLSVDVAFPQTGSKDKLSLRVGYSSVDDPTLRPLPLDTLFVPWAPAHRPVPPMPESKTDLDGGDFERGKSLFFAEQLKCGACHRVRGEGATIGPDLSNLVSRDAATILRDIKDPNASIHPDYVAYNVELRRGELLSGFVRAQDERLIRLIGADGKETVLDRLDVRELRTSAVSLMPSGLLDGIPESQIRDLLTFLLSEPPRRTRSELEAALQTNRSSSVQNANASSIRPLNIVLVASEQDHGPGQHDYPAWQKKWNELLARSPGVSVTNAWLWPAAGQFERADLLVFYFWNHDWSAQRYAELDKYLQRGGGVVVFHSATIADKDPEQLAERIGLASQPARTKYIHAPFDLKIVAPTNHPLARGLPERIHFLDEPYWPMIGDTNKVRVLATAEQEKQEWPMVWTFEKDKGRVFASILGHYMWTHDDPLFRIFVFRGLAWAAGEPESRFDELARLGIE